MRHISEIIAENYGELLESSECEFCGGTGFIVEDGFDSIGNIERGVNERRCICQVDDDGDSHLQDI